MARSIEQAIIEATNIRETGLLDERVTEFADFGLPVSTDVPMETLSGAAGLETPFCRKSEFVEKKTH